MSGNSKTPVVAMCTYRIKNGKEEEFVGLLGRHWPTLRDLELVEDTPPPVFRGTDDWEHLFRGDSYLERRRDAGPRPRTARCDGRVGTDGNVLRGKVGPPPDGVPDGSGGIVTYP